MTRNEIVGKEVEDRFIVLLNKRHIYYEPLDQRRGRLPYTLKKIGGKRPDFIITGWHGKCAVDCKSIGPSSRLYNNLTVAVDDVEKLVRFQTFARIPVFLVFSNKAQYNFLTWFSIAADDVEGCIKKHESDGKEFFAIPISKCRRIDSQRDSPLKLFYTSNRSGKHTYPRRYANSGRVWWQADNRLLIKSYNDHMSMQEIASILNRSKGAVRSQLKKLGVIG